MKYLRVRQSTTGKLHLSGGINSVHCSSGNRGMQTVASLTIKTAMTFPKDHFCKKCFGKHPYRTLDRILKWQDF